MKVNLVNKYFFFECIFCEVLNIEFSLNFMSPVYMNSITALIFCLFLPNKSNCFIPVLKNRMFFHFNIFAAMAVFSTMKNKTDKIRKYYVI